MRNDSYVDDDYLEDVKDGLIYAKKLAVDEDNRVLVWTGDTGEPPGSIPISTTPTQAEVTPQIRPSHAFFTQVSHTDAGLQASYGFKAYSHRCRDQGALFHWPLRVQGQRIALAVR